MKKSEIYKQDCEFFGEELTNKLYTYIYNVICEDNEFILNELSKVGEPIDMPFPGTGPNPFGPNIATGMEAAKQDKKGNFFANLFDKALKNQKTKDGLTKKLKDDPEMAKAVKDTVNKMPIANSPFAIQLKTIQDPNYLYTQPIGEYLPKQLTTGQKLLAFLQKPLKWLIDPVHITQILGTAGGILLIAMIIKKVKESGKLNKYPNLKKVDQQMKNVSENNNEEFELARNKLIKESEHNKLVRDIISEPHTYFNY